MNFKIIHRNNPQDLNSAGKYYPAPVYHSTINLKNLANEIAHSTSLTFLLRKILKNPFFIPDYHLKGSYFVPVKNFLNIFFGRPKFLPCIQLSMTRQRLGPSDFLTPSKITPIWRRL